MTADATFKKYPYFLYPQAAALADASDAKERETLARRVATYIGDTITLRSLLGLDPEEFACFYPDQGSPDLTTNETISSFLTLFGKGDTPSCDLPMAPAVDYATILDRLEAEADAPMPGDLPAATDATADAIDSFLASVPPPQAPPATGAASAAPPVARVQPCVEIPAPTESAPVVEEPLSEKRARLMIREGHYDKALDILTRLQLRDATNPCYEDQIRFLRKLILNSSRK